MTSAESKVHQLIQERFRRVLIHEYMAKAVDRAGFGGLNILRTPLGTRITIKTERPGIVIGRKGRDIQRLTDDIERLFELENPQIEAIEVKNVHLNPQIMASKLVFALERGWNFRRAGNAMLQRVMEAGARGCQITLTGKLTGRRHRSEKFISGHIKHCGETAIKFMQTGFAVARRKEGVIGCKVAIMPPDAKLPDEVTIRDLEAEAAAAVKAEEEARRRAEERAAKEAAAEAAAKAKAKLEKAAAAKKKADKATKADAEAAVETAAKVRARTKPPTKAPEAPARTEPAPEQAPGSAPGPESKPQLEPPARSRPEPRATDDPKPETKAPARPPVRPEALEAAKAEPEPIPEKPRETARAKTPGKAETEPAPEPAPVAGKTDEKPSADPEPEGKPEPSGKDDPKPEAKAKAKAKDKAKDEVKTVTGGGG